MSRKNSIGKTVKMLHAKLANHLAGPFLEFLPRQWIDETLAEMGYRFRESAFSPLGYVVGVHRPMS